MLKLWLIKKKFQQQKSRTKRLPRGIYQTFNKELTPILMKLFQKIRGRNTTRLMLWDSITLTPKQEKDATRNVQADIPDEYRCKDADLNTSKLNLAAH